MGFVTLGAESIKARNAFKAPFELLDELQTSLISRWQRLEQVTFGLFVASLAALLILTYAGVPVVAGP